MGVSIPGRTCHIYINIKSLKQGPKELSPNGFFVICRSDRNVFGEGKSIFFFEFLIEHDMIRISIGYSNHTGFSEEPEIQKYKILTEVFSFNDKNSS